LLSNNLPGRYNYSKLFPKSIGPYHVSKELIFTQNWKTYLSENLELLNISSVFHTSLSKPYFPNPIRFIGREKTMLGPIDKKDIRYKIERVME